MKRRALLGLSVGVVAGFAGCSTLGSNAEPTPSPEPLAFIDMENLSDEPHTFDVLVRRDGEIVHWEQYDIQAAGTTEDGQNLVASGERIPAAEFDGCTPGVYMIDYRLGDGRRGSEEWQIQANYQGFKIQIRRDGTLSKALIFERDSTC